MALPAAAAPAPDRRPDGVLRRRDPRLQAAVGVRLPHQGSGRHGRAGACLHPGRRVRLRRAWPLPRHGRGRVRARPVVLLRRPHRLLRGDRQVPRRAADLGDLLEEVDVDVFAPGLSFFFDAHIDFFEEIAKFRAARRIWARWMRDSYGARTERAQWLRFHTQTAGVSLTAQKPDNNVVRTAIEALAAALGGTQSLHTNALDEVLALPGEAAAETA